MARTLHMNGPMLRFRWRPVALTLAAGVALACAATALSPGRYVARGGVLLPGGMVKAEYSASDPQTAAALVREFIARQKDPLLVDPPLVVRSTPRLGNPWFFGLGLAFFAGLIFLGRRPRAAARSEKDLVGTLGVPIVAARPLAARELARQLLTHWFERGRPVLAVVSAQPGDGAARVAAELARACAASGEPTLLIDADFRAPVVHRLFGVRNRAGVADFLEDRKTAPARCGENLEVLVAGRTRGDPLELLSRSRMQALLAAAAQRYRVVLVNTPAAARGPDLQLSAAFAGGALVVTRFSTEIPALERLRDLLAFCRARVVGTVVSPAVRPIS
jgi:Mrp family chromosome partitioning ATPase